MSTAAAEYEKIIAMLVAKEEITVGQMFGKACLKVGGKAFASLHNEKLVFKLANEHHKKALSLRGAELWDPSGKGRPMKEWVALPITEAKHFKVLATQALAYVKSTQ